MDSLHVINTAQDKAVPLKLVALKPTYEPEPRGGLGGAREAGESSSLAGSVT
jgi:hypothetical protein